MHVYYYLRMTSLREQIWFFWQWKEDKQPGENQCQRTKQYNWCRIWKEEWWQPPPSSIGNGTQNQRWAIQGLLWGAAKCWVQQRHGHNRRLGQLVVLLKTVWGSFGKREHICNISRTICIWSFKLYSLQQPMCCTLSSMSNSRTLLSTQVCVESITKLQFDKMQ